MVDDGTDDSYTDDTSMEIHLTRMTVILTIRQVMAPRMIHRKVTPTQMIHRITARMTRIQMIAIQMIPRHMMKIPVVWRIIQMENDLIKYILNSHGYKI
ncbi:MAG: hypothetical protein ACLTDF_11225 [Coprococcus sp.]